LVGLVWFGFGFFSVELEIALEPHGLNPGAILVRIAVGFVGRKPDFGVTRKRKMRFF